jgi:hypothetical protein
MIRLRSSFPALFSGALIIAASVHAEDPVAITIDWAGGAVGDFG